MDFTTTENSNFGFEIDFDTPLGPTSERMEHILHGLTMEGTLPATLTGVRSDFGGYECFESIYNPDQSTIEGFLMDLDGSNAVFQQGYPDALFPNASNPWPLDSRNQQIYCGGRSMYDQVSAHGSYVHHSGPHKPAGAFSPAAEQQDYREFSDSCDCTLHHYTNANSGHASPHGYSLDEYPHAETLGYSSPMLQSPLDAQGLGPLNPELYETGNSKTKDKAISASGPALLAPTWIAPTEQPIQSRHSDQPDQRSDNIQSPHISEAQEKRKKKGQWEISPDDEILLRLKENDKLSWKNISKRFKEAGGKNSGIIHLRTRYATLCGMRLVLGKRFVLPSQSSQNNNSTGASTPHEELICMVPQTECRTPTPDYQKEAPQEQRQDITPNMGEPMSQPFVRQQYQSVIDADLLKQSSQCHNSFANTPISELVCVQSPDGYPDSTPNFGRSTTPPMLDRYLSDTSDEESVDTDAILTAVSESLPRSSLDTPPLRHMASANSFRSAISGGSSKSAYSVASAYSVKSVRSAGSKVSLNGRRKHKKSYETINKTINPTHFQCTFCPNRKFTIQGNWTRHEESVHLVTKTWICAIDGPFDKASGQCIYCERLPEDCMGLEGCCGHSCAEKDIQARTFSRQDHFEQHLKSIHFKDGDHNYRIRELAKISQHKKPSPEQSRCGFCGMNFQSWDRRQRHIADHFLRGKKQMSQWEGDWGLSAEWMEVVLKNHAKLPPWSTDDRKSGQRKIPVARQYGHKLSAPPPTKKPAFLKLSEPPPMLAPSPRTAHPLYRIHTQPNGHRFWSQFLDELPQTRQESEILLGTPYILGALHSNQGASLSRSGDFATSCWPAVPTVTV